MLIFWTLCLDRLHVYELVLPDMNAPVYILQAHKGYELTLNFNISECLALVLLCNGLPKGYTYIHKYQMLTL